MSWPTKILKITNSKYNFFRYTQISKVLSYKTKKQKKKTIQIWTFPVHTQVESVVKSDEAIANKAAAAANAIRRECEAELNLALPLLEGATAALNTIRYI